MKQDEIQKQATQVWAMLDDMAKNDPNGYKKFIKKQIVEEKKFNKAPLCKWTIRTTTGVI